MKQLMQQLKALADPTRLRVVRILMQKGTVGVSQLLKLTKVEPTLLSHHLAVLRHASIVVPTRIGKCVVYELAGNSGVNELILKRFNITFK